MWKVNEIYKEGKTIKILFKEVTSDEKYPFLYVVISYREWFNPYMYSILDRIYIIWKTITIIWSVKLGKVNEIYKEGKTIKISFKEVTSD